MTVGRFYNVHLGKKNVIPFSQLIQEYRHIYPDFFFENVEQSGDL